MFFFGKRWKFILVFIFSILFSLSGFSVAGSLHEAAKDGDLGKVKGLIAEGSDVNVSDENALTPLHLAAYRGHKDIAELLILNGADVNATDKAGINPLNLAEEKGHKEIVELLIKHGAHK